MQAFAPTIVAALVLALFAGLFRWMRGKQPGSVSRDVVVLFAVAFMARVVGAIVVHVWLELGNGSPFLFGFLGDDFRYHSIAEGLSRRWSIEGYRLPDVLYTRGFEVALGTLYWLTYPSVVVGKVLNVIAGALIPVATYRILRELDDPRAAWTAGVIAALFPPLIFWSTVVYKDTLLTLAILTVLVAGIEVLRAGKLSTASAGVGVVALAMVAVLRLQSVLIVAVAMATFALVRQGQTSALKRTIHVLVAILVVWLALAIFSTTFLSGGERGIAWYLGLDRIDLFYEARSIAFQTRDSAIEDRFLSTPIQFVASFLLPLPLFVDVGSRWQATEHAYLAGNLVWLWLLFYMGLTIVKASPEERWKWLPIVAMVVGTAAAISVRGYAMIYRHKVQMYPFVIMLASIGLSRISWGAWARHRALGFIWAGGVGLVIVVYNYLRLALVAR